VAANEVAPELRTRVDVVIIGTGAGGSMALYELSRAGLSVLAIERGAWLRPQDMTQREDEMIPLLFAEQGGRGTADLGVTILQGIGVGGSTLHNTNLCKRLPDALADEWQNGLGLALPGLDADFDVVEALLHVNRVPDARVNANNAVFARGLAALGWRGGRLAHNRDERCQQSGFCELGCAYNGKTNATRVLIPPAVQAGGAILTQARVEHVHHSGRRAQSIEGTLFDASGRRPSGRFTIEADTIVLAGSATSSAALFRSSALPDRSGLAGRTLHMHPGAAVMGLHDEPIEGWRGNPQSMECTEFLEFGEHARNRVWLVSGFAHPAGAAALMPGFGPDHAARMRRYAEASVVISMLHDVTMGVVDPGRTDALRIHYRLNDADRRQMVTGLRESARLLLAGGAREVMVPLSPPLTVRSEADLDQIRLDRIRNGSPTLTAVHPMSSLRMSVSDRTGVTTADGRVHAMDNVWVADGSLFPTSIGGPPQISVYTFGRRVARAILQSRGMGLAEVAPVEAYRRPAPALA
jgi:choline dehydrogenase-like flavoprotein